MADSDTAPAPAAASPAAPQPAAVQTAPPPAPVLADDKPRRAWTRYALMAIVPLVLLAIGAYFWLTSGRSVSTENAYVQQDRVAIAPEVGGRVVEVAVRENQHVEAGDLLFRLDAQPYQIAIQQADANIAAAEVKLVTDQTSLAGTSADIAAAREGIAFAQQDYARQAALLKDGFTTKARYQAAQHAVAQARAQLAAAEARQAEARSKLATGSSVPGENPAIALGKAAKAKAALDISRTEIRAPIAGVIAQSARLQPGQTLVAGMPAITVVARDKSWIEANFKETDLSKMRPGQRAEIEVDAYKGLKLKGHVLSIGAGTGSEFSILPAQNANGNWVKVTQRIPVRIAIDEASPRQLIAGQSVNVTVDLLDPPVQPRTN